MAIIRDCPDCPYILEKVHIHEHTKLTKKSLDLKKESSKRPKDINY